MSAGCCCCTGALSLSPRLASLSLGDGVAFGVVGGRCALFLGVGLRHDISVARASSGGELASDSTPNSSFSSRATGVSSTTGDPQARTLDHTSPWWSTKRPIRQDLRDRQPSRNFCQVRHKSGDLPHHLIRVKGWTKLRRPNRVCRTLAMGHVPVQVIETCLIFLKRPTASHTDILLCHCASPSLL